MLQRAKSLITADNAERLRFEKRSIEEIATIGGNVSNIGDAFVLKHNKNKQT
jgi:hypothetical protein